LVVDNCASYPRNIEGLQNVEKTYRGTGKGWRIVLWLEVKDDQRKL
jgi:hypothetical protein